MGIEPHDHRETRPGERTSVYVTHDDGQSGVTDAERAGDAARRYRLVVPVLDIDTDDYEADVERLLGTARAIAGEHDGTLVVTNVVVYPDQTPLERARADERTERARSEAERLAGLVGEDGSAVGNVRLAHSETTAVLGAIEDGDAVLLGVRGEATQRRRLLLGDTVEKVVARAECDVFVQRFGDEPSADELGTSERAIHRVLLAAGGGPHSGLAAETARAIARPTDARVDVVHGVPEDGSADDRATAILEAATHVLGDASGETELLRTDDPAGTIIERSAEYDLTVLGAPTEGLLKQFVFGSLPEQVRQGARNTVVMAKENTPDRTSLYYRWIGGDETE